MSFFISSSRNYLFAFLITLGVFLVLVAGSTELLIRKQVEPNDTLFFHLDLFCKSRSSDIALGDSHTANGFAATGSFINLAYPNENISAITRKVALYIKNKPPGRIVLQADPHMFAAYQLKKDVGYISYLEKRDGENSAQVSDIRLLNSYHRSKLLAYWVVFLQHGKLKGTSVMHSNGWLPSTGNWTSVNPEKRVSQARWRADMQRPVDGFEGKQPAREYRNTLNLLVRQGWKPCMVEYPATDELLKYTQADNFAKARAWYRRVAEETGAKYLSYKSIFKNQPELFSNQDHLNPQGAAIFTKTAIHECFDLQ